MDDFNDLTDLGDGHTRCNTCNATWVTGEIPTHYFHPKDRGVELKGDPRFKALLDRMWEMHCKKAADYGHGKDHLANLRNSAKFGVRPWVGALIREADKTERLVSYIENGTLANEGVEDTLMDKACYSLLALILWQEDQQGIAPTGVVGGGVSGPDGPLFTGRGGELPDEIAALINEKRIKEWAQSQKRS